MLPGINFNYKPNVPFRVEVVKCHNVHLAFSFPALQVHIGFCIIAAVAPPIFFKGKSLT